MGISVKLLMGYGKLLRSNPVNISEMKNDFLGGFKKLNS
jgi:hypothetical protein